MTIMIFIILIIVAFGINSCLFFFFCLGRPLDTAASVTLRPMNNYGMVSVSLGDVSPESKTPHCKEPIKAEAQVSPPGSSLSCCFICSSFSGCVKTLHNLKRFNFCLETDQNEIMSYAQYVCMMNVITIQLSHC